MHIFVPRDDRTRKRLFYIVFNYSSSNCRRTNTVFAVSFSKFTKYVTNLVYAGGLMAMRHILFQDYANCHCYLLPLAEYNYTVSSCFLHFFTFAAWSYITFDFESAVYIRHTMQYMNYFHPRSINPRTFSCRKYRRYVARCMMQLRFVRAGENYIRPEFARFTVKKIFIWQSEAASPQQKVVDVESQQPTYLKKRGTT